VDAKPKPPGKTQRAARLLSSALAGLVLCWVALMWFEDSLIYFPTRFPDGYWEPAEHPGEGEVWPRIEDVEFASGDGTQLHGWLAEPVRRKDGADEPVPGSQVLLWFHGNAGNLTYRYDMLARIVRRLSLRVFIVDYRGYGKSQGSPSESGLYQDARGAWDYLTGSRGVAPEDVVILGKSLGGGPASELATQVTPGGLILQSTFTSVRDMATRVAPFVPRFLVRTKMASIDKVARVACPLLVVHGDQDEVIPFAMGEALYNAAQEPKRFYRVPGAHHNDTYLVGGDAYLDALGEFLASCKKRP
jgi:fermentation-respiration switch protein FrsA (DUF1100 family)